MSPGGGGVKQAHHSGFLQDDFLGYGDVQREDANECDESYLPDHKSSGVECRLADLIQV